MRAYTLRKSELGKQPLLRLYRTVFFLAVTLVWLPILKVCAEDISGYSTGHPHSKSEARDSAEGAAYAEYRRAHPGLQPRGAIVSEDIQLIDAEYNLYSATVVVRFADVPTVELKPRSSVTTKSDDTQPNPVPKTMVEEVLPGLSISPTEAIERLGNTGEPNCVKYMKLVLEAAGVDLSKIPEGSKTTLKQQLFMEAPILAFGDVPVIREQKVLAGDEESKGVVKALVDANLGVEVSRDDIRVNDLVQYWIRKGNEIKGHTAVVIGERDENGKYTLKGPLNGVPDRTWKTKLLGIKRNDGKRAVYAVRPNIKKSAGK